MPWASRNPTDARALEKKKPREKPDGYSVGGWPGLDDPTPSEKAMTDLVTADGELKKSLPACDTSNPAELEAHHGNFAYADHFRKVVLANCREIQRAKATERGEKVSEARLDDLARVSDTYVDFLITNLKGRVLREQNVIDSRVGA